MFTCCTIIVFSFILIKSDLNSSQCLRVSSVINIVFSRKLRSSILQVAANRAKYVAYTEILENLLKPPEKRWERHQIFNSAHLEKHACYWNVHLHFLLLLSTNNYYAHTVLDTEPLSKHLCYIMFASPRLNTDTPTKHKNPNSQLSVRTAREEEWATSKRGKMCTTRIETRLNRNRFLF